MEFLTIFSQKNGESTNLDDFRFHKYADLEYSFTEICVLTIFWTKTGK
eukprot:UN20962